MLLAYCQGGRNHLETNINQIRFLIRGERILPKGEKNKLTAEQREEIKSLRGQESAYKIAKQFNVTHTAVYKLWKTHDRNQQKPNPLDPQLIMKFCKLFKDSTTYIPEESRKAFTDDLTEQEEQRIREILTGGIVS